jgi:hypothetical protein
MALRVSQRLVLELPLAVAVLVAQVGLTALVVTALQLLARLVAVVAVTAVVLLVLLVRLYLARVVTTLTALAAALPMEQTAQLAVAEQVAMALQTVVRAAMEQT